MAGTSVHGEAVIRIIRTLVPCSAISEEYIEVLERSCSSMMLEYLAREEHTEQEHLLMDRGALSSTVSVTFDSVLDEDYLDSELLIRRKTVEGAEHGTVETSAIIGKEAFTHSRYTCPKCGKLYSQSRNLRRHCRLECGQEPAYICEICCKRFKRNNQLQRHIRLLHP
ncbi:zinc finger protein 480-like isoform X2 [Anopheles albimanus]|uniref:zinc finger protein 480-like isoform X2 n=1 Tax=Anopheles albimanus TaxID=7167 RepID=UPI001641B979|nr:zinc finger protein 480-like isoform X2 [Anopheles albimanus]